MRVCFSDSGSLKGAGSSGAFEYSGPVLRGSGSSSRSSCRRGEGSRSTGQANAQGALEPRSYGFVLCCSGRRDSVNFPSWFMAIGHDLDRSCGMLGECDDTQSVELSHESNAHTWCNTKGRTQARTSHRGCTAIPCTHTQHHPHKCSNNV